MLVPMVDTIFADVAQPDQARIVAINASYFLKVGGHFVISIKVRFCITRYNKEIRGNKIGYKIRIIIMVN